MRTKRTSSKYLTPSDWAVIIDKYLKGDTTKNLAATYKISAGTINYKIKSAGFKMRPMGHYMGLRNGSPMSKVNSYYFDTIDTEEKAYFLGLMGSDGCVSRDLRRFEIGLSGEEDRIVIQKFKECLEFTGKITEKQPNYVGSKKHFRITVSDKRLAEDLCRHGIVPAKSLAYELNLNIRDDLMRHYIRGYFDGDGTASIKKNGSISASVMSSLIFIEELKKQVLKNVGINGHVERCKPPRNVLTGSFKLGGSFSCFLFLDWIYKDAKIALPRKEAKYLFCKEAVKQRLSKVENLYNLKSHKDIMENVKKCAEILNIDLKLEDWNGLSSSKEEQARILQLYNDGYAVKNISDMDGCSSNLVRNILIRNGFKIRNESEQAVAKKKLLIKIQADSV